MSKSREAMPKGIQFEQIDRYFDDVPLVSDRLRSQKSVFALMNLEHYINGVVLQWNRIMQEELVAYRLLGEGSSLAGRTLSHTPLSEQEQLFLKQVGKRHWMTRAVSSLDVHFYLICWDKVNNQFEKLVSLEHYPGIGSAWKSVRTFIGKSHDARNFFEHLEEKNQQGHGIEMSGNDELVFRYVDTDRQTRQDLPEKRVKLGKAEVRMVIKAYEEVINALKAIDPKHLQLVNRETTK